MGYGHKKSNIVNTTQLHEHVILKLVAALYRPKLFDWYEKISLWVVFGGGVEVVVLWRGI